MKNFEVGDIVWISYPGWEGVGKVVQIFESGNISVKRKDSTGAFGGSVGAFSPVELRHIPTSTLCVEKLGQELENYSTNTDSANRKIIAAMAEVILALGKKLL